MCSSDLKSFLQTAKLLKIKGMDFDMGEDNECETTSTSRTKEERNIKDVSISVKENHIQRSFDDSYYGDMSRVESTLPDGTSVEEDDGNTGDADDDHSNLNNEHFEDEKDYTEILLEDDNEMGEEDGAECDENEEDEEGFPLQPEVSFREDTEDALAMNSMSSGLEIKSYQSMRTSWNMPHSSSTNNNNLGTTNRNSKGRQGQGFGNSQVSSQQNSSPQQTGKDGILLRMMREPLKSSATAGSYAHQAPYDS